MEGGTTQEGYDEFEILLGEIPHATSESPQTGSADVISPSPDQGKRYPLLSKFSGLYRSPQAAEDGINMALYGGSAFSKSLSAPELRYNGKLDDANYGHETPTQSADQNGPNLPNGKTLELAFEDLNFTDRPSMRQNTSLPVNSYTSSLNYSRSELCSTQIPAPSMTSNVNGINMFSPGREENSYSMSMNGVSKFRGNIDKYQTLQSSLGNFVGHQISPVNSGSVPPTSAAHGYGLLPTVPIHRIELEPSAYHRQYYMDTPSPAYISPQDLDLSNMRYQDMERRYSAIDQYYFHPRQFEHQPCFERPLSRQIEQVGQNPFWNSNGISKEIHQLDLSPTSDGLCRYHSLHPHMQCESCRILHYRNLTTEGGPTCSAKDFQGHRVIGSQYYPENVLIGSHGVNSLRPCRSDPVIIDQMQWLSDNKGKMVSSNHVSLPCVLSNGLFGLNDQNSQHSFPDVSISQSEKSILVGYDSLDEVVGRILSMAKDPHDYRFLQKKLIEGAPEDVTKIFIEIVDHIGELMINPTGNYIVEKLLDVCNEVQKMCLLISITRTPGELMRISCNMHGAHLVQKIIATLKTKKEFSMVASSLKSAIVTLMKDIKGYHVANRCLQYIPPEYNQFLFDAAVAHCFELAADRQGCCVLQRCIYHSDEIQKHELMSLISSNSLILSQDPYGNFVVQYILDQKVTWVTDTVLDKLEGNYESLSMQKYSSNVVEKCLNVAAEVQLSKIIHELMNSPRLLNILLDRYGNYVIQTALVRCKGEIYAALVKAIKPYKPDLRISSYGSCILPCLILQK